MADAKPRKLRGVALGTAGVILAWLLAVWPPPVWWRDHWPRETAMMREQAVAGARSARPAVRPAALQEIAPVPRLRRDAPRRGRRPAGCERCPRLLVRRRRGVATPRPAAGREHHHPAAR